MSPATARVAARECAEELRFTLTNDLAQLTHANARVTEHLARRGVEESAVYSTQLALEEAVSNVIRHGYDAGSRNEIAVAVRVEDTRVELEVSDAGRAFDPVAAASPDLTLPLEKRRPGGLGIHLLRAFVSELRYERILGRNVLLLRI